MNNIYLVGFMGTGKTTVASEIQKFLPFQVVEMDSAIEALAAMSIPMIFEKSGEEGFRKTESMLLEVISKQKNQIVSTGGGIVTVENNISVMKESGTVIWLKATAKTVYDRVINCNNRPLLKDKKTVEDIQNMMDNRNEMYLKASDIEITVDDKTPKEIASEIISQLALTDRLC
ncbi:MAG: shikimate kinase [Pseudobutyrivibrio sp.]|nr:shikimate kinase [Pseudobutyrivibrio sp.]